MGLFDKIKKSLFGKKEDEGEKQEQKPEKKDETQEAEQATELSDTNPEVKPVEEDEEKYTKTGITSPPNRIYKIV